MTNGTDLKNHTVRRGAPIWRWRVLLCGILIFVVVCPAVLRGVPLTGIVGPRLQSAARAQGVTVKFDRIVWHLYRGLVARGITIQPANNANGPTASIAEATVDLDWARSVFSKTILLKSIQVRGARATLPGPSEGASSDDLQLTNISAELHWISKDVIRIKELQCAFSGLRVAAQGVITNAAVLFERRIASEASVNWTRAWGYWLAEFARLRKQLEFEREPELHLRVAGDLARQESFEIGLRTRVAAVGSPWGKASDCHIELAVGPRDSRVNFAKPRLAFRTKNLETPALAVENLDLFLVLEQPSVRSAGLEAKWHLAASIVRARSVRVFDATAQGSTRAEDATTSQFRSSFTLTSARIQTPRVSASDAILHGTVAHSLMNFTPGEFDLRVDVREITTDVGRIGALMLSARSKPWVSGNKPAAESPATWREFVSTRSTALKITASEMDCSRLRIKNAGLEATFFNDTLRVERLEADLAGRSVVLGPAMLDITNLRFTGRLLSNADPHSVKPLLNAKAAAWLDRFQWRDPPEVEAWVDGPFPPGINLTTNRWSDVLAGWHVEAAIRGREAAYLDVPIASASLKLSLSNSVLRITDFLIMRPEGAAHLQYELEIPTRKFKWEVNGSLNLREISPALGAGVPSVLSAFEFRRPPRVTGTIIGSWLLPRPLACALTINATDLVFRGEPVEKLDAFVSSSNNVVTASNVVIKIGNEWINAPLVKVDLGVPEVSITGLQCCIDPLRVARVIGPEVVAALEPYRFENPPSAFVSGRIAFPKGLTEPDLVFDVAGGPFRFWRLRASEIQGMVHWRRHTLLVTNLAGVLYHGRLAGHVRAELDRTNETSIQFTAQVRNADLALVASELFHHTGRIEGLISGSLNVTNGLATEIDTWTGYGAAQMRDGSLWDLPIFGVLSPVLNTVVPGLGNSKARSANATFTLRDGVVRTDDLLIDAGPAILRYRGSSDLQGNVNARVEAEILASTPLVGPFISFVLTPVSKIFVFQVTGTLAKPKLEPVYVPKFLMLLLRPLHTLRNVLPGGGDTSLPSSSKPSEPRNDNR